MLKNVLTIAYRSLVRQKGHAFINVSGLAMGMACCMLIALFVYDEFTYDRFHERADRIYRVLWLFGPGEEDGLAAMAHTPWLLAEVMESNLAAVERTVRLDRSSHVLRRGDRTFREDVKFADPAFFDVFSFPLSAGDPATALRDPGAVVLTQETARKYFGAEDPMGQPLSIRLDEAFHDFTVSGITQPPPANSSVTFDVLLPMEARTRFDRTLVSPNWGTLRPELYVQLGSSDQAAGLEAALPGFVEQYLPEAHRPHGFRLQPLLDVHLTPGVIGFLSPASNPLYSYFLIVIALLVLIIACINFTTLSIGRSVSRAREVGVRKVVGARPMQLRVQFWGEAFMMTALALAISLVLAWLALPLFNELAGKDLTLGGRPFVTTILGLGGIVVLVALLAGSYPAVYLSRFSPVEALKGRRTPGDRHRLTGALVVLQFAVSILLIVSALLMARQLRLLQTKELGFQEEQVVVVDVPFYEGVRLLERYRDALADQPRVRGVSGSFTPLGYYDRPGYQARPLQSGDVEIDAAQMVVSPDFVETLGLNLVDGRSWVEAGARDGVIVNEAMVRAMGWEAPLGRRISQIFSVEDAPVIGVVRDFHYRSLHHRIEPLYLRVDAYVTTLYIRIVPDDVAGTLAILRAVWADVAPDLPFEFAFLDEAIERQYRAEERWAAIVRYASMFAVFIACLGLFGLATLAVARRTREIGVRKVLGAGAGQIAVLLCRDAFRHVLVAAVLAAPVAYVVMNRWLDSFAYRVEIGPAVFVWAGAAALAIALLTVSGQALKAALTNPVEALRQE